MYLGSTTDETVFKSKKSDGGEDKDEFKKKINKTKSLENVHSHCHSHHYPIELKFSDNVRLFLLKRFCCLFCCKKGKNGRLMRLFAEGEDRLNTDFSLD